MFGLNEDHRRATYRNVSNAQKGESSAKSEAALAVCGGRNIGVIGARRVDEVCGVGHFGDQSPKPRRSRPGRTAVFDFLTNGYLNCGIL